MPAVGPDSVVSRDQDSGEVGPERSVRELSRDRRKLERDEVRRFTRGARAGRRRWLWIGGGALSVIAFVLIAFFSPITAVREIRVEGTRALPADQVAAALGDLQGRPLAQVTASDVGERLSPFVLVQSYSVQVVPPSILVVRIVERVPVGTVEVNGAPTLVDAAGVALGDAAASATVPAIDTGGTAGAGFPAAAQVSLALGDAFRTITAATSNSVELTLRDGTTVVWGGAEDSARKTQVFTALRTATAGQGVSVYDVSSPEAPVTR